LDELTDRELHNLKLTEVEQRRKYRVHWSKYLNKNLLYKQPQVINGAAYHNIDDEIDLSLVKDKDGNYIPLESDSEPEEQVVPEQKKPIKKKPIDEEESTKPRKPIPNEKKWDIIYCLPLFAKPGKHTYMIKFKNTKERGQKRLLQER
jgi:hypothetical protein